MKKIRQLTVLFWHLFFRLFTLPKKRVIIFQSFDNTLKGMYERPIFNEIFKRYSNKYEIVWICEQDKQDAELPQSVRVVKPNTIKAAWELRKAKYFISGTFSKNPFLSKKINFFYLNHGYSVKIMGMDWVNSITGFKRLFRKIAHKNQTKQIDICFVHDQYDKESYKRIFYSGKSRKNIKFIINGFPRMQIFEKGEDILFLPSWHEKGEIRFPKVDSDRKFVSFHPRTTKKDIPKGWKEISAEERKQLKLKYVFSDNSAAPLEYIKSGIQAYWLKGEYNRSFCQEFKDTYSKLMIDSETFKPLSKKEYKKITTNILNLPSNQESIKLTVDSMNIE